MADLSRLAASGRRPAAKNRTGALRPRAAPAPRDRMRTLCNGKSPVSECVIIEHPDFAGLAAREDMFAFVQSLKGDIARAVPGRETRRFEFAGGIYYRKLHTGVGYAELFKNWLRLRAPITGARNEWDALKRLAASGIHTLTPVAFGERGLNPATRLSFLITEELGNTVKLHELLADRPRWQALGHRRQRQIMLEVARIARLLHAAGINHRDFYLCHFLVDQTQLDHADSPIKIYLVDLHRAQLRSQVPTRWRVKDIASLDFSSRDFGLCHITLLRFLRAYFAKPLPEIFAEHARLLDHIKRRADQLYAREARLRTRGLRP